MDRPQLEQRSALFAHNIFGLCRALRTASGGRNVANQLQDAASSVAANYRASGRSRSQAEFTAKIGVTTEEADEAVFWLEFICQTGLAPRSNVTALLSEGKALRAIFAASYRTARKNPANRRRKR